MGDLAKPGFERSPSPEYIRKLAELEKMRMAIGQLSDEQKAKESVVGFLDKFSLLMSSDTYRFDNPAPFMEQAEELLEEGDKLLNTIK